MRQGGEESPLPPGERVRVRGKRGEDSRGATHSIPLAPSLSPGLRGSDGNPHRNGNGLASGRETQRC